MHGFPWLKLEGLLRMSPDMHLLFLFGMTPLHKIPQSIVNIATIVCNTVATLTSLWGHPAPYQQNLLAMFRFGKKVNCLQPGIYFHLEMHLSILFTKFIKYPKYTLVSRLDLETTNWSGSFRWTPEKFTVIQQM